MKVTRRSSLLHFSFKKTALPVTRLRIVSNRRLVFPFSFGAHTSKDRSPTTTQSLRSLFRFSHDCRRMLPR